MDKKHFIVAKANLTLIALGQKIGQLRLKKSYLPNDNNVLEIEEKLSLLASGRLE